MPRAIAAFALLCLFALFSASPLAAREDADCIVAFKVIGPVCEPRHLASAVPTARFGTYLRAPQAARVDPAIHEKVTYAAMRHGVPSDIAHAVVKMESGYRPRVRGQAGEWGLGQILCATARGEGMTGSCARLADPDVNLEFSMRYLRRALDRGGVEYYNAGIHARFVPASARAYARAVAALRR